MGNYTPYMLEFWLHDIILWSRIGISHPQYTGGIRLLDESEELDSKFLYIGEPQVIQALLESGRFPEDGICIVSAGAHDWLKQYDFSERQTIFLTSLSLTALYNRTQHFIHWFHDWDSQLHEVVYKNAGLQEMLERAAAGINATLLLANTGYKYIAAYQHPDIQDPTATELVESGYHKFDTIQIIQHETPLRRGETNESVEYISSLSSNYTIVHLIRYKGHLVARLCVILNGPDPNYCYSDMAAVLAGYVAEYMFSNQGADYSSNADFGMLAADLIECRLTDPEELEQRLRQIKLAVRRYYHLMLVSFENLNERHTIPWNYVISQLEYIFPFSNITTYKGNILMIFRKKRRGRNFSFDQQQLLKILETYNAYAAISNTSEFLTSLPPLYHQTNDALRLGKAMNPEKRFYFYEDYSIYQIIEFAAEAARQKLGSRNLVHLCNNEMIALVMYDKKKGTNLADIAYTYLVNERNTSETAKTLFIHRNTMLYKIHQIEEIIGTSLDDPLIRERMMFSYHVLEYMQKYLKEDILVLKRAQNEERKE